MISHLALLWPFFFLFMWEFQTNSSWNVRCVFKMMHLILKRTSQEIQYKIDHSLENGAHLSIWAATFPPSFFFHSLKKKPAAVHLISTDHVISFSRKLPVRDRLQQSCHTASADMVGSVYAGRLRLFGVHIHFWPPAEMMSWNRGTLSLLAATSGTTRHIRIRLILAGVSTSRFMVTFYWTVTTVWSRCPCLWSIFSFLLLWYR